ncbi:ribosome maturation protein RlbA [Bacillus atrophaeus]|nr:ribosome maturation protein RlbA [Bacillus atrophaeus]MCY9204422.1 ribosome maturation protein RlbA [Bacillus atrophaeus]MEC0884835.1 ribosome maturation protein RlbA [Bacillus atrophaeus]
MANPISIDTEMITLGQFLKLADVIQSGGMAKWFLSEHEVFVNNEPDNRRGRKLYVGDVVAIEGFGSFQVVNLSR